VTELTAFLASVYDAFSEAEMQALQHGQARLAELLKSGTVPEDVSVPVYHASEVQVNLDVGLVAEKTEDGMEVFVTDADTENASQLNFGVELFELLEEEDLEDLEYDKIFPGSGGSPTKPPSEEREEKRRREEEKRHKEAEKREEEKREEEEKRKEEEKREEEDQYEVTGERIPPIDVIDDIEPRYRTRLKGEGIERLPDLLELSSEEITETLAEADAEVSTEEAAEWLSEARGLASLLSERDADLPVELVDGIGPTFGSRLREAGFGDLSDLAVASPEEIADHASTDAVTVSAERAATWLDRAESHLAAMESGEQPELHSEVDPIDLESETEESAAAETEEPAGEPGSSKPETSEESAESKEPSAESEEPSAESDGTTDE